MDFEIIYCKVCLKEGQGSKEFEVVFYLIFGGMFKDGFISYMVGK